MASKQSKPLPQPKAGQVVRVVNGKAKDGYRRGGQKHPKGQKDWPLDTFSATQLEALDNDPRLQVSVIDAPKGDEASQ
jgi:hypothetical protein